MSDDLSKFLIELNAISSEMGVYPEAVQGYNDERDYTQRDGYKNGWNAAVMEYGMKLASAGFKAQEPWSDPEKVFASDPGVFEPRTKGGWMVNLSDTWYYACADCEDIEPEEYKDVAKWYRDYGYAGVLWWVFLKREHEPQVARPKKLVQAFRVMLESIK